MNLSEPGRYYYGLCYMEAEPGYVFPKGGNIQLCVWRKDEEPTHWHFDYRFRYYETRDNAWDGKDRESGWEMSADFGDKPVEEAIGGFLKVMRQAQNAMGVVLSNPDWIFILGGPDRALDAIESANKSWLHMKKLTEEEARAEGYKIPKL